MVGTILEIDGDYAVIRYDSGTTSHVALALLPDDADVGMRIRFENFEYSKENP